MFLRWCILLALICVFSRFHQAVGRPQSKSIHDFQYCLIDYLNTIGIIQFTNQEAFNDNPPENCENAHKEINATVDMMYTLIYLNLQDALGDEDETNCMIDVFRVTKFMEYNVIATAAVQLQPKNGFQELKNLLRISKNIFIYATMKCLINTDMVSDLFVDLANKINVNETELGCIADYVGRNKLMRDFYVENLDEFLSEKLMQDSEIDEDSFEAYPEVSSSIHENKSINLNLKYSSNFPSNFEQTTPNSIDNIELTSYNTDLKHFDQNKVSNNAESVIADFYDTNINKFGERIETLTSSMRIPTTASETRESINKNVPSENERENVSSAEEITENETSSDTNEYGQYEGQHHSIEFTTSVNLNSDNDPLTQRSNIQNSNKPNHSIHNENDEILVHDGLTTSPKIDDINSTLHKEQYLQIIPSKLKNVDYLPKPRSFKKFLSAFSIDNIISSDETIQSATNFNESTTVSNHIYTYGSIEDPDDLKPTTTETSFDENGVQFSHKFEKLAKSFRIKLDENGEKSELIEKERGLTKSIESMNVESQDTPNFKQESINFEENLIITTEILSNELFKEHTTENQDFVKISSASVALSSEESSKQLDEFLKSLEEDVENLRVLNKNSPNKITNKTIQNDNLDNKGSDESNTKLVENQEISQENLENLDATEEAINTLENRAQTDLKSDSLSDLLPITTEMESIAQKTDAYELLDGLSKEKLQNLSTTLKFEDTTITPYNSENVFYEISTSSAEISKAVDGKIETLKEIFDEASNFSESPMSSSEKGDKSAKTKKSRISFKISKDFKKLRGKFEMLDHKSNMSSRGFLIDEKIPKISIKKLRIFVKNPEQDLMNSGKSEFNDILDIHEPVTDKTNFTNPKESSVEIVEASSENSFQKLAKNLKSSKSKNPELLIPDSRIKRQISTSYDQCSTIVNNLQSKIRRYNFESMDDDLNECMGELVSQQDIDDFFVFAILKVHGSKKLEKNEKNKKLMNLIVGFIDKFIECTDLYGFVRMAGLPGDF